MTYVCIMHVQTTSEHDIARGEWYLQNISMRDYATACFHTTYFVSYSKRVWHAHRITSRIAPHHFTQSLPTLSLSLSIDSLCTPTSCSPLLYLHTPHARDTYPEKTATNQPHYHYGDEHTKIHVQLMVTYNQHVNSSYILY